MLTNRYLYIYIKFIPTMSDSLCVRYVTGTISYRYVRVYVVSSYLVAVKCLNVKNSRDRVAKWESSGFDLVFWE